MQARVVLERVRRGTLYPFEGVIRTLLQFVCACSLCSKCTKSRPKHSKPCTFVTPSLKWSASDGGWGSLPGENPANQLWLPRELRPRFRPLVGHRQRSSPWFRVELKEINNISCYRACCHSFSVEETTHWHRKVSIYL